MRILVVCGAGASSTFLGVRLRRAARDAGRSATVTPIAATDLRGTLAGLHDRSADRATDASTVVVAARTIIDALPAIADTARAHGAPLVVLDDALLRDPSGAATLAAIDDALNESGAAAAASR